MRAGEQRAATWVDCIDDADRSQWHPAVRQFFDYWRQISPADRLPGRWHFDPMHIPGLLPRLWLLDVVRRPDGLRYRYRLAGTLEVETLEREVTGQWFDIVHAAAPGLRAALRRLDHMVAWRVATWRKGSVLLLHHKDHKTVENCMVPLAADG